MKNRPGASLPRLRVYCAKVGNGLLPSFAFIDTALMATTKRRMRKSLTAYGDEEFSLFLRKAFVKAMGYAVRLSCSIHKTCDTRLLFP